MVVEIKALGSPVLFSNIQGSGLGVRFSLK